jgi:hypothetical protein
MSMTYQEAITALNDPRYQTVVGLKQLVNQVSVEIPGHVSSASTLLYSGMVGNLPAWQLAEAIGQFSNGQVITIGETPIAKFLESSDFEAALRQAAGFPEAAQILLINPAIK